MQFFGRLHRSNGDRVQSVVTSAFLRETLRLSRDARMRKQRKTDRRKERWKGVGGKKHKENDELERYEK